MLSDRTIEAKDFGAWLGEYLADVAKADVAPALDGVGELLRKGFAAAFASETGPNGQAWAARASSQITAHPDFAGRRLLVLSGDLFFAATTSAGIGNINQLAPQELLVGVSAGSVPYAAFHQFGTSNMPARPFIYATEETVQASANLLADWLLENIL